MVISEGLVTISLSTYSANFARVVFSPVSVLFPYKVNFIFDVFASNFLNSALLFISFLRFLVPLMSCLELL